MLARIACYFVILALSSSALSAENPIISSISVKGNKNISDDAILVRTGLHSGVSYESKDVTGAVERLLSFGYFSRVFVEKEEEGDDKVKIIVRVVEKPMLSNYSFEGNNAIPAKKMAKELELEDRETIDEYDIDAMVAKIRKMYRKENYYSINIKSNLFEDKERAGYVRAVFMIEEGEKTRVVRVDFEGCKGLPEHKVRSMIFTKEDWIGSFSDGAGRYDKDRIEADKKEIERVYQDHGYLSSRVVEAKIDESDNGRQINVTFVIDEGPQFKIRYVTLPADDEFPEHKFLRFLLVKEGEIFSRSKLNYTTDFFRKVLGEGGYIEADVWADNPVVDKEKGLVDLQFHIDKGKKFHINRIDITGNKVTRDWVIRREIGFEEGSLATKAGMDAAKENVEYLGYFERGAVEWKKHRIGDGKIDLELNVKEARTGQGNFGVSYGGSSTTSNESLKIGGEINKRNLFGRAWDVGLGVKFGKWQFQNLNADFSNDHVFDKNISFGISGYVTRGEYEEWKDKVSDSPPLERNAGAVARVGAILTPFGSRVRAMGEFGVEDLSFGEFKNKQGSSAYQKVVNSKFNDGKISWFGGTISNDRRNHRVNPSKGWKWELRDKVAMPSMNRDHSFIKIDGSAAWHTSLMAQEKLVLSAFGKAGAVASLDSEKPIPFKEIYHMGGVNSVRGFKYGEAGPRWDVSTKVLAPLGATKMMLGSLELSTPVGEGDQAPRAYLFYDIGGGWDTPIPNGLTRSDFDSLASTNTDKSVDELFKSQVKRDRFSLRHSVGIGIRMTAPYPVDIAWGYKLDRDKSVNEQPSEMNISMNMPL
jgi:outer membrane protein insertion porin family